jgi:hypothetical protein
LVRAKVSRALVCGDVEAELFRSHGSKAVDAHQHGDMRVWEVLGWQINETSSCTDKPTVSLKLGQGFIGDEVARIVDRVHSPSRAIRRRRAWACTVSSTRGHR